MEQLGTGSKPASWAAARIPGPLALLVNWSGSLPLPQSEETPGPQVPAPFVTQTGSHWTWWLLRHTALYHRWTVWWQGPTPTSSQPLLPHVCFSWVKVTLINIIYMNNLPLTSNHHMAQWLCILLNMYQIVLFIVFDYHSHLDCNQGAFSFLDYFKVIHLQFKNNRLK